MMDSTVIVLQWFSSELQFVKLAKAKVITSIILHFGSSNRP